MGLDHKLHRPSIRESHILSCLLDVLTTFAVDVNAALAAEHLDLAVRLFDKGRLRTAAFNEAKLIGSDGNFVIHGRNRIDLT